jgi:PAS domain S-box-containing protein
MGPVKQYVLGLADLTTIYVVMGKLYPIFSRGAGVKAKKVGPHQVEIVSTPKKGVNEKPYQCENRLGSFEGIAKLFTKGLAKIEHPTCFHKGGDACRYVITWQRTPSLSWKRLRNYSFWLSVLICPALFFVLPDMIWAGLVFLCGFLNVILFCYYSHLEKRDLIKTVEMQGDTAKGHLDEINKRYNEALLVQEIGKAASTNLDVKELIHAVLGLMEKRLEYDRGMVMLANEEKTRLQYMAGYGYSSEQEERLRQNALPLDDSKSGEAFVSTFKRQKPSLINSVGEKEKRLSEDMQTFAEQKGAGSLICLPIVYEKEALGILTVDNRAAKRPLTQSDMNLLMGLASQTAVGIVNAVSFEKLREGEERYRTILESIEEGYFETDLAGNLIFVNDALCKISGYPRHELLGMNNRDYTAPETAEKMYQVFSQVYTSGKPAKVMDYEIITKDGGRRILELSTSLVRDQAGENTGFRGVIRDVTDRLLAEREKKNLEAQLQHAQKMESIGIIASGVAHNFRNVLAGISANSQLLDLRYGDDEKLGEIAGRINSSVKKGAHGL